MASGSVNVRAIGCVSAIAVLVVGGIVAWVALREPSSPPVPEGVRARVACNGGESGYVCSVVSESGETSAEVCWNIAITCEVGMASAHACQRVDAHGTATRLVPYSSFTNMDACTHPVGTAIAGMTVMP